MTEILIITGAKYLVALPVVVLAIYFFFIPAAQRKRFVFLVALSLLLAYIFARIAGLFYQHIQPFALEGFEPLIPHAVDNAFPSDHVVLTGALATVAFLYSRWLGVGLWALALGIGLARVWAGLHYPVDILAGAVLSVIAVSLAVFVMRPR